MSERDEMNEAAEACERLDALRREEEAALVQAVAEDLDLQILHPKMTAKQRRAVLRRRRQEAPG